jgi:YggT family protein
MQTLLPVLPPLPVPAVQPLLPVPILSWIIYYGLGFLTVAMLIRMIASWFRIDESFAIIRFLARITDPFIQPCRRVMGNSVGILDLGFLVTWFLIVTLQILLLQSLPSGW